MLRRIDGYDDKRWYRDTETNKFYISATSFCASVLPENKYLTKWKQDLGEFEANRRAKEAADYGTLMHLLAEDFLNNEELSSYEFEISIEDFCVSKGRKDLINTWKPRLRKDLIAFAQFCWDKKVVPINIEKWAKRDLTDFGGIAGTIDLECELIFNRKPRRAIVDLKSGRKGFYPASELQLALYKKTLGNPDLMLFNWSPCDWRKDVPTYNLKNQTDTPMMAKLENYIEIAKIDGLFQPNFKRTEFEVLKLGHAPEYSVKGIEDLVKEVA